MTGCCQYLPAAERQSVSCPGSCIAKLNPAKMKDLLTYMRQRVNGDTALTRIGRYCSAEIMLEVGARAAYISIERGRVKGVARGPIAMRAWHFAIRAPEESWRRFWQPVPEPGYQDIFAMSRFGHARIEGDVGPMLSDLRFIKALLALPRERPELVSNVVRGGAA